MTQWNGKRTQIIILILLLCLGPANYFHLQHTEPHDLQNVSLTYAGKCVDVFVEKEYHGSINKVTYFLRMDDGQEFWIDSIYSQQGDFDFAHFCDTAPGSTMTVRYIDVNYSLGSFAKEAVELRSNDEVFLSIDVVERASHRTRVAMWVTYAVVLTAHILVMVIDYLIARRQRKLTAHRQQTKAKRRAWLDAHPEEKGAPPSARRKKDRR